MSEEESPEVGYGRPPVQTRFQKGRSGNPKGRPKGAKNFATALSAELNSRVVVTENGKRRKISRREVIAKQLVNRAVTGDPKALPILFNETRALETAAPPIMAVSIVRQEDRAVMSSILQRLRAADEFRTIEASSQTITAQILAAAEDNAELERDPASQEAGPDDVA